MIGLDTIADPAERSAVAERIAATGRRVVDLTHEQVEAFAGNAIELTGSSGRILVLSARAFASLRDDQLYAIGRDCTIVPVAVPTIELAGGSVRCMIAGIHTAARAAASSVDSLGEDFSTDGEPLAVALH
jgi:hypothetical protein